MTNATLVKITRYVSLLGCGVLAGVAVTVLVLELALRRLNGQEYARVRQAEFAFFSPFIGAVLLATLVAVAMLVVHARKTHSITLRPAIIALALLLLALLVSLAVNGPVNVEQLSWNVQTPGRLGAHTRSLADRPCRTDPRDCARTRLPQRCDPGPPGPRHARPQQEGRPLNPALQARDHAWHHDTACPRQMLRRRSLSATSPHKVQPKITRRPDQAPRPGT
jgi:hypothetical protein